MSGAVFFELMILARFSSLIAPKKCIFGLFWRKKQLFCIFFGETFGGSEKSSTFALAKRKQTDCSLKYWTTEMRNSRASESRSKGTWLCRAQPRKPKIVKQFAEIAQLVEHNLAKVRVASSSLVFRSQVWICVYNRWVGVKPRWRNGRRARFRCECWETCRFESCSGHKPNEYLTYWTKWRDGGIGRRATLRG